jgi:DNA topoisomerase-3
MVAGRMLEAFHQECMKEITKITIESGALFIANGTVIRSAGWRSVFNESGRRQKGRRQSSITKSCSVDEKLPIVNKALLEKAD